MKKILIASIVGNVALITLMLLARNRHEAELHSYTQMMMRADETYIDLLGQTLDAMESPESEDSKATADLVRKLVTTGNENKKLRRSLGL